MLEPRVRMKRLETRITAFEEQPIVKNMILFYGDSAFTRWKEQYGNPNVEDVIRMKDGSQAVVNHGFGSSTAEEALYYYPRAVKPWEPRALILQSYGNDGGFAYSPAEVLAIQTRIFEYARTDFPGIKLFFCNIRPLLKYQDYPKSKLLAAQEYNELVAQYCARHEDVTLVDHNSSPVFFEDGKQGDLLAARAEMFIEDRVHYNPEGFEIYRKFFAEILDDLL